MMGIEILLFLYTTTDGWTSRCEINIPVAAFHQVLALCCMLLIQLQILKLINFGCDADNFLLRTVYRLRYLIWSVSYQTAYTYSYKQMHLQPAESHSREKITIISISPIPFYHLQLQHCRNLAIIILDFDFYMILCSYSNSNWVFNIFIVNLNGCFLSH